MTNLKYYYQALNERENKAIDQLQEYFSCHVIHPQALYFVKNGQILLEIDNQVPTEGWCVFFLRL